jgi:hypothetical protein
MEEDNNSSFESMTSIKALAFFCKTCGLVGLFLRTHVNWFWCSIAVPVALVIPSPLFPQDVEQKARSKQGFDPSTIKNSIISGNLTTYDRDENITSQAVFKLYRQYPNQLRMELTYKDRVDIVGTDGIAVWTNNPGKLTAVEARNIQGWGRLWPERLFLDRAAGGSYREVGKYNEEYQAASPGKGLVLLNPQPESDQVEIQDNTGVLPLGDSKTTSNVRSLNYFVDTQSSLTRRMSWLEPEDPTLQPNDPALPWLDVRVGFDSWQTVGATLWPFEIIRWWGGKVDLILKLTAVETNQSVDGSLFKGP